MIKAKKEPHFSIRTTINSNKGEKYLTDPIKGNQTALKTKKRKGMTTAKPAAASTSLEMKENQSIEDVGMGTTRLVTK